MDAGGVVALSVEHRTCDREVVGSSLGRARGVETLGKFLTLVCLCSPSSISWYRPKGGDALRLGSKGLSKHVSNTCTACFYWLRQLRCFRRTLDAESDATLVHAFVASRVDY